VGVQSKIGLLDDPGRKVLALYIERTALLKNLSGISHSIAAIKVAHCIEDFIVVHDRDKVILVIVDVNQLRKDREAFFNGRDGLVERVRSLLGTNVKVDYPTDPQYDPRMIWDSEDYGGLKAVKKRPMLWRPR